MSYPTQALPLDWELLVEAIGAYVEQLGGCWSAAGSGAIVELCQPLGPQTSTVVYTTQKGAIGSAPTIWPEGSIAEVFVVHDDGTPSLHHASWSFLAGKDPETGTFCLDIGGYGTAQYACQLIREMAGIDDDDMEWHDGTSAPVAFRAWPSQGIDAPSREASV
jgi:hypothetical protein